jgi:hypothetical protein
MNTAEFIPAASSLKIKEISIIAGVCLSFIVLVIILVGVFKGKKSKKATNQTMPGQIKSLNRNGALGSSKRGKKDKKQIDSPDYDNAHGLDDEDEFQKQSIQQQQQQQLLICNNKAEMQAHLSCTSNTSTLMKHHANRTPSHHQALIINNPNHMMMNPLSINYNSSAANPGSNNNHSNLTDVEFYSNMTSQQLFTNNSHVNSDSGFNHNDNYNSFNQHNQNYNYYNHQQQQQQQQNHFGNRFGDENNMNDEMSNEAALAAANAAFNSPFMSCNANGGLMPGAGLSSSNEPSFLRHTIRPKPIAIPLNATSMSNQSNSLMGDNQSVFSMSNSARKSFKNLRKF